jgi:hypothetical protein
MENLTTNKYYRIIPVKIKDKKIVRVREIPTIESKNLRKALLNKSISTSTEQTYATNNTTTNKNNQQNTSIIQPNKQFEQFTTVLAQKYEEIINRMKKGIEMIGTVEENIGEYPNLDPFCLVTNTHTQSHISYTKKVFFEKTGEDLACYKVLDSNLFFTIYNKPPPQRKYLKKNEIARLIKIQKRCKGIYIRECDRTADRLRVKGSLLEIILLLTGKAYDNAIKKITFKKLKKEFHDPFNNINDELKFEDKIQFKLPNRYYNFCNFSEVGEPN